MAYIVLKDMKLNEVDYKIGDIFPEELVEPRLLKVRKIGLTGDIQEIAEDIYDLTNLPKKGNPFTYDAFLAAGENNNAKLIAAYFNQNGCS